jgi:hypothetical protein
MIWKPILILSLSFIAFGQQTPQLKTPGERHSDSLPQELTETETQRILKERNPKPHVDATLKVSDARLASAFSLVDQSQYNSAAQDVGVYTALIIYADAYTRKLPDSKLKDRNNCLKKIEQTILKQSRMVEAVMREFPVDYRDTLDTKIDQVRQIRLQAINDLIGGGRVIKISDE